MSNPLLTSCSVKQGSVLSPTLFLAVMDLLLRKVRDSNIELSICGQHIGATVHADVLLTTAASSGNLFDQPKIINVFA